MKQALHMRKSRVSVRDGVVTPVKSAEATWKTVHSVPKKSPKKSSGNKASIEHLLGQTMVNLEVLRSYARKPGGFVNGELRSRVWTILMDIDRYDSTYYMKYCQVQKTCQQHRDASQVEIDIERSLYHLTQSPSHAWSNELLKRERRVLCKTILSFLSKNSNLHYYQGFHDIVTVLLLIFRHSSHDEHGRSKEWRKGAATSPNALDVRDRAMWDADSRSSSDTESDVSETMTDEHAACSAAGGCSDDDKALVTATFTTSTEQKTLALLYHAVDKFSLHYLQDFMASDFLVLGKIIPLVLRIVKFRDKNLYDFLEKANVQPFFATSWVITWFAHDIKNVDVICRVWDVLLCSPPSYILYVCSAVILAQRNKIMAAECEFSVIHHMLCGCIENLGSTFEEQILPLTDELWEEIPLDRLFKSCDALRSMGLEAHQLPCKGAGHCNGCGYIHFFDEASIGLHTINITKSDSALRAWSLTPVKTRRLLEKSDEVKRQEERKNRMTKYMEVHIGFIGSETTKFSRIQRVLRDILSSLMNLVTPGYDDEEGGDRASRSHWATLYCKSISDRSYILFFIGFFAGVFVLQRQDCETLLCRSFYFDSGSHKEGD